jgi:glycosyltransferase involved in cell wall biosynthesis
VRILSLSNCPLDESLGSGYVAIRYARELRARGHCVDLLGPEDYEPLRRLRRATSYRQALGMAAASLRRVAKTDFDVVEIWGGEGWLALELLARTPRRRFLLVSHSNGLETHCAEILRSAEGAGRLAPSRRWYQLDQSALFARAFRAADALVTVAAFDREYALREGYAPPDRVLAVDNPLLDEYLALRVDFRRPPVIGYCGSWIPRKGVALLESALPDLLRSRPGWRLVLVGVGEGFRPERHFPEDILPRVEVVPFAERTTRLCALYQSFAIVVLPSLYESFGLVGAEAMACGAALAATRVGFASGLRDREEALLLAEPSAEALREALEALTGDEELRQTVARGGYRRVQPLRWSLAAGAVEAAYLGWLGERRGETGRGEPR